MALTWGDNGNWVKMDAQGDKVRGPQRIKAIVWYATGATAGTTLLAVRELSSEAPICADVADSTQLSRVLLAPEGEIQGIEVNDLDAGYLIVYFKEQETRRVTAKGVHDASPAVI